MNRELAGDPRVDGERLTSVASSSGEALPNFHGLPSAKLSRAQADGHVPTRAGKVVVGQLPAACNLEPGAAHSESFSEGVQLVNSVSEQVARRPEPPAVIHQGIDVDHASDYTPPRLGAAFWLLQDGSGDTGPAYDLLSLESPRRAGKYWRLSLLLGSRSGGVSLTADLWTESYGGQAVTLTIGGAAITESLEAGEWTPGAVVTIRVGGAE